MAVEVIRSDDIERRRISRGPQPPDVIEARPITVPLLPAPARAVTLSDLVATLWRRRRLIAAIVLPLMIVTLVIVKQIAPTYTAEGAMVIASRKFMIPELESVTMPTGDAAIVRSEVAVLRSRILLHAVASKLQLDTSPEFNPRLRKPDDSWLARLDPRIYINRIFAQPPTRIPDDSEIVAADVESTLYRNLEVGNDSRDYVVTIHYRSLDPVLSAKIVNTLMSEYLQQYMQSKLNATVGANSSLDRRAQELRHDLEDADAKVEAFATKNGLLETRLGSVSSQQLNDLNTQLSNARADRAAAEARYAQAVGLQRNGGTSATSTDVLASPLIQQLRAKEADLAAQEHDISTRLGPNHPDRQSVERQLSDIRRSISVEIGKVVTSLKGEVEVTRAREQTLTQKIGQIEGVARINSDAQTQLQRLKDDADGKRKVYNEFLLRLAQTAKPDDQQQPDARIISNAAAPISPSNPRVFQIVLLTGVVGTLASFAGVLLHAELDNGYENLGEVRTTTGLVGFAAVPLVRRRGRRRLWHRYVLDNPHSAFAETLRGFRARLQAIARYRPAKTVLITSAEVGEGKTSIALAFARLTARDGHRVLLIECDLRRPTLGEVLAPSSAAEFSDVLGGRMPWRESIRVDQTSGLHYLVTEKGIGNVSQVLEGDGLRRILREAADEYDFVIVDSPPVMRVPDAILLAHQVDVVGLVVCWKRTLRREVAETLRRLDMHGDKVFGLILNKVAPDHVTHDTFRGYGA